MSPRDALKRITAPFSTAPKPFVFRKEALDSAQARIAALMNEVVDEPSLFPQSYERTQPRRDVGEAPRWLVFSDALAIVWGFVAAWVVAASVNMLFLGREIAFADASAELIRVIHSFAIAVGVLIWFAHRGHYRTRLPFWMETQQVVKAFCFAIMLDGFMQFASKQDLSRLWVVSGWVIGCFAVLVFRALMRHFMRRRGLWQIRTLLVGSGPVADEARAALRSEPGLGYEIAMQIENLPLLLERAGQSWRKLCDRFNADYVVIALDGRALADSEEALVLLSREGIPYSISPPLRHLPVLGMAPQYFFNHDVMLMAPNSNLEMPLPRMLKRTLDVIGSGLGLLVLSPIFLTLVALVKRDGGPAFFGDERVGLNGKTFCCLKFRSMVMDADRILWQHLEANPQKKMEWTMYHKLREGDPRVTRIGLFLRRWSLDELPQLINVLRGDMSLVGPRPIMARERDTYSSDLVHYCRVRPGLTGLWQVSGRSDVSFARRVQMDIWYVRNWSLWHDLAIVCKTIPAILKKTGAY